MNLKKLLLILQNQFTSIGGQAVIEGVMMRSPNAFVVAVRTPEGKIKLRKDQWFGFSKKFEFLKFPFFRGVLILIETMANGIVSLNYSANIAMAEEKREELRKKGKSEEEIEKLEEGEQKVTWQTFLTIGGSLIFGMGLFVALPHLLTALLENSVGAKWGLQSIQFHLIDGAIKATIFLLYIFLIGLLPDVKRVFQYHGAEHKSISTFESGKDLKVDNAVLFTTFHPRCGTTFIFFLIFISIILFAGIFVFIPMPTNIHPIAKHFIAVGYKILLSFPVAGISYELIKWSGKNVNSVFGKIISVPGMMLQRLTTREPDESQLEVALASIKTVLLLEEKFELNKANKKILSVEEIEIENLADIESSSLVLKDFLE